MGVVELIGTAASISLLAGWRLYLCIFGVGLAMATGWLHPPDHLHQLTVLANPWVIGAAGIAALCEFLADKVMWIDSLWDTVHSVVRPIGGALLALAIVDPSDPAWQVAALILGGGGSLMAHGAKAGARAVVNLSPEPASNVIVSTGEDVVTGGFLAIALASPVAAVIIALILFVAVIAGLVVLRRLMRRVFPRPDPTR